MTTVNIILARSNSRAITGGTLQVPGSQSTARTLTDPTTSTDSGITGAIAGQDVWLVTADATDFWVKCGTGTPVVTIGGNDCYLVKAGTTRPFGVTADDEKLVVIDG